MSHLNKKQGRLPLWILISTSTLLVFALSTIGLYAYQNKSGKPETSVQYAHLEIEKQQILQQDDVIETNWLHTLNPLVKDVRGSVIWSSTKQQGIMQFANLPRLFKNQQYQLLISDLNAESSRAIEAVFSQKDIQEQKNTPLLIAFKTNEKIETPFKFELMLKENGVEGSQPLLLAQP